MLTRLLETAANAADAAQSGSTTFDMTQLTNILDWFMIVLLPAVALCSTPSSASDGTASCLITSCSIPAGARRTTASTRTASSTTSCRA